MRSLMVVNLILWLALAGSGCEKKTEVQKSEAPKGVVQVVGPLKVNDRGTLLLCGTQEGSTVRYYNVRLDAADGEAKVLAIPGVSRCLGAGWRHNAGSDELLWITGGEHNELIKFDIKANGISRISSIPIDPNYIVTTSSYAWGRSGNVIPLRAARCDGSGIHLGFLRIDNGVLHESSMSPAGEMLWTDESTFYMVTGYRTMVLSKAIFNSQTMAVETSEVLRAEEIRLATQGLDGAVVYLVGTELFAGDRRLCVLPEKVRPGGRLHVDGGYLAYISSSGMVYVLDRTGDIIRSRQIDEASSLFGLSALMRSVYGVTEGLRGEHSYDCVYSYDFEEDTMKELFSVESQY
ncbi:hypothetical protein [Anaerobaca lacustris]|uniref:Uncharacterized protein n=1 Tax=Anaerobaca lacustris TaxID=3044600 RepID=A0AAW6U2E1_9BACT|nr:hypothetical protein [Sedimentisphaerales bacterium M17dextr]